MKTIIATIFSLLFVCSIAFAQPYHTKQAPLPCLNKKVSVVAHIVRDSFGNTGITEEEILAVMDTTNSFFSPICLSFEICEFRMIDNFQYDSLMSENHWEEMQVKYHQNNRFNLFFVTDIIYLPFDCGYADIGGIQDVTALGALVKKECVFEDTKWIAHEIGAYMGLFNTFEGNGIELVNGDNCETDGDQICDTPSDPYVLGEAIIPSYLSPQDSCRFISMKTDANGEFYKPHVANVMSQYPSYCACGFTYEQLLKMANNYLEAEDKMW